MQPVGIVLFNLGGPATLAEVEPFLVNLFSDREIIELPLGARMQPLMARLIAKRRGPSVRRNYAAIGGGSPQLRITIAQAEALEARLNGGRPADAGSIGASPRFRVFVAMRYSRPTAEDALGAMAAAGIRRVVTLTLFPHWSKATTGSSATAFDRALADPRWRDHGFEVSTIDRYGDDPVYLDALAATVRRGLDDFEPAARRRAVLLFSAHGLPQKFVDEGDPYVAETEVTRRGVLERLAVSNRHILGYQSRTGPVQWIGPGTEELIERLAHQGIRELLIVPLSFVSDHIETLYEVDMLFREVAERAGIREYRRPEALNTSPLFIEALAGLIERHLHRMCEAPAVAAGARS
jgi:protoporphyrin/coproporphyrin ferrochelatase